MGIHLADGYRSGSGTCRSKNPAGILICLPLFMGLLHQIVCDRMKQPINKNQLHVAVTGPIENNP